MKKKIVELSPTAEAFVEALEKADKASIARDIPTEAGIVEPDSLEIIKARKRAHQAMLRGG